MPALTLRFIVFACIYLGAVGFLNPKGMFSAQAIRAMFYGFSVIGLAMAVASRPQLDIRYPKKTYFVLLAAILFSAVMASAFHPQSLTVSVMTILPALFGYAFLFTLVRLEIPERDIIRFLMACAFVAVPVYFANVATFPNYLFGEAADKVEDMTRGILRVAVPFMDVIVMFLFYGLGRWMSTRNFKWIALIAMCTVMIFLSVTRQVIAISAVLGVIFVVRHSGWLVRIAVAGGVALTIFVILPSIPAYQAMTELSEDQAEHNEVNDEDIRVYDYRYFCDEFQTNDLTRIFGNGMPSFGNSRWGDFVDSEWDTNGTFLVDVGWAGFYWEFGAIAVVCLLSLMLSGATRRKPREKTYLGYTMWYLILTSVAGGPILYQFQILDICIVLYLIYLPAAGKDAEGRITESTLPRPRRRTLADLRNTP